MMIIYAFSNYEKGCFYFTLGNIHPKFQSTLKSIQLLAISKSKHIKEYGIDKVLNVIIDDIILLEKSECSLDIHVYMYICINCLFFQGCANGNL